ncbi:MAG: ABC transporter substrate-binding protein [Rhodocyclaceae bacterium]|nr:ABC transporter substrate-binding protein [Rhodocyclaceae bacterium]
MKLLRLTLALLLIAAGARHALAAPYRIMIVTWNGCEQACQGFQDYLHEQGMDSEFLMRDAGSQAARLAEFRQEAVSIKPDLVLTYGTNVSQALAGALDDKTAQAELPVPKIFMIVADPVAAGLVHSLDDPGRPDVTGTYNRVPETVNIETIRNYLPTFKRLGMLVNANEKNSLVKRDEMAELGKSIGFELVSEEIALGADGKPLAADIPDKLARLKAAGVDFIYLGSSSFLRAQRDAFTDGALALGLPVLSPYELLVRESRALISVAARYYDVGRLAGEQARHILKEGATPGQLPVARMTRFAITINMGVAKQLKKIPPIDLLQVAEIVH